MQAGQGSEGRAVALAAASEKQEQDRVGGAVAPAAPQLSVGGKRKTVGGKVGEKAENNEGIFELEGTG